MKLSMRSGRDAAALSLKPVTCACVGPVVDDRGQAAAAIAREWAATTYELSFDPETNQIEVDGKAVAQTDLDRLLNVDSLLLEATTLGLAEVFVAAKARQTVGRQDLTIIYAEPLEYETPERSRPSKRRNFALSGEVKNFAGLPGATLLRRRDEPEKIVFFLGYEGQRLEQVMEQNDLNPDECTLVYGVPAFQAGWEMNAFANNVSVMRDRDLRHVMYAGAQNPTAAYEVLDAVYYSGGRRRMIIAPIGTKPHGVAAALFACEHSGIGIIYDHPMRRTGRSRQVASWHAYEVRFG